MNKIAAIGDNNPPSPIDDALAPYDAEIEEAQNWLDGVAVENEGQMKAVDRLLAGVKGAEKAVKAAEDSEAKPIYDEWKAAKARYAPTLEDLARIKKGLVSILDAFKRKLAAEKAEAERLARMEADKMRRAAEAAARAASAADIEAQRAADKAMEDAKAAEAQAKAASKDRVKGLRKVARYEITDHRALLNWIAKNHRDDVTAFIEEWARRNHKSIAAADGLRVWQEKEAF